jgi:hypothetical protein
MNPVVYLFEIGGIDLVCHDLAEARRLGN